MFWPSTNVIAFTTSLMAAVVWVPPSGCQERKVTPFQEDFVIAKLLEDSTFTLALDFSDNGKWLVSAGSAATQDGRSLVKKWDMSDYKTFEVYGSPARSYFWNVAISPEGTCVSAVTTDTQVFLWKKGRITHSFKHYENVVAKCGLLTFMNEKELLVVDGWGLVRRFDVTNGKSRLFHCGVERVPSVAIDESRSRLAYWGYDARLSVMEVEFTKAYFQTPTYEKDYAACLALSHDSKRVLAAIVRDGKHFLTLFDVDRKKRIKTWECDKISCCVALPKRPLFATADQHGVISFWKYDGSLLMRVQKHKREIHALACSRDGKILASGGSRQPILLWSLETILKDFPGAKGEAGEK